MDTMKYWILLPVLLLLPWTLADSEISVVKTSGGFTLSCGDGNVVRPPKGDSKTSLPVSYEDENSGEYTCLEGVTEKEGRKIYVKFRKCENCIELDVGSIVGLAIGNVVATIVIGVAVYLIASQGQISAATLEKKRSDRQHLIPNESNHRAPNDHYQPLKHKGGKKDTYDVLTNRR